MDATIVLLLVIICLLLFIGFQYRVIANLTDRVMAKDYREYKALSNDKPAEPEQPKRKPMSWADDVDYDEDIKQ